MITNEGNLAMIIKALICEKKQKYKAQIKGIILHTNVWLYILREC